jgi:lambda repressor-like predicted transcriptional regulator
MPQGKAPKIDLETVHQLQAQGLSQREIARRLQLPRSTLQDILKRPLPTKKADIHGATNVHISSPTEVPPQEATKVHIDLPLADLTDFHELLAWWRRRKHLLAQANNAPAPTERWTMHIERPFITRIKAEAEAEHVTVTEVINRIIRHYYEG